MQLYNQAQQSGIAPNAIPPQDAQSANQGLFSNLVSDYLGQAVQTGQNSEQLAIQGALNQANLTDVVTAVSEAEMTLQTVVAIRDKVVDAYKEILRMPM
ncbi:MAG: flagellar hook-basal body complex protein FliE [Magnetovibrio sp.]|nr:flagellar hook-basal body complex protein FliE [Magnetovibrio sp.]